MSRDYFTSNGTLIDESGSFQSVSADGTVTNETSSSGPAAVNLIGVAQSSADVSPPGAITVSAGGVTFAVTSPENGRVFQRVAGAADIPISLTYANGTPASIQARLVVSGTSTVVGADWATVVASPSGGAASFTMSSVPANGTWCDIQVRDSAAPTVVTTYGSFGAGILDLIFGQSNAMKWFTVGTNDNSGATVPAPDSRVRVYGNSTSNAWQVPSQTSMAGAIAYGNALAAATGQLVGLLDFGIDGSALVSTTPSTRWINPGPVAGVYYTQCKNGVLSVTNKIERATWIHAEADAVYNVSGDDYFNGLTTLFSWVRTDFGTATTPIVLALLGWRTSGVTTALDASWDVIRQAQVRKCNDPNIYRVERYDLIPDADGIHYKAAGFMALAARCAFVSAYTAGIGSYYRGPRISSVQQVSSTVYDLTIQHAGGTDFTPGTAITGLRALDGGTTEITISNAVHYNATTMRVTLASAPTGILTFSNDYGCQPASTGFVKDNTPLALPLEYASSVAVGTVNADGTVTLTGVSASAIAATIAAKGSAVVAVSIVGGQSDTGTVSATGGATVSATGVSSLAGVGSVSASVGAALATTITIQVLEDDGVTPRAGLAGLKWSFFDQASIDLVHAPSAQGSGAGTDASGYLVLDVRGTSLQPGQFGLLMFGNGDGTPTQTPPASAFVGAVQVA